MDREDKPDDLGLGFKRFAIQPSHDGDQGSIQETCPHLAWQILREIPGQIIPKVFGKPVFVISLYLILLSIGLNVILLSRKPKKTPFQCLPLSKSANLILFLGLPWAYAACFFNKLLIAVKQLRQK